MSKGIVQAPLLLIIVFYRMIHEDIQNGDHSMYQTLPAEVRNGRIQLIEKVKIPDGARVLVTVINEDDRVFWRKASDVSLKKIWVNKDDDVYENLIVK
jgi:hypothetical protein